MNRPLIVFLGLLVPAGIFLPGVSAADATAGRWTAERAWGWYDAQPWLVGCNFLPSTAVNDVEMWQKETFDATTIERELGWARDLGFNSVRVFLNFVVWQADPDGLKQPYGEFLAIADRSGISVMPILFDDCNFAGRVAATGPQPAPVPGVHNSQWVSSPPLAWVTDRAAWPALERYAKDLIDAFARDRRIVVWDLYNEPGNGMGEQSRPLVEAVFGWAREIKPIQPLTIGAWADFNSPFSRRLMELSDVISFHAYDGLAGTEAKVQICREYGRPILCTEWMARGQGSRFETHLPFFRTNRIGCFNWGLVAGRTQTYFPWGSPPGAPEPKLWHHDILRVDGTPFKPGEVEFIKRHSRPADPPVSPADPAADGAALQPSLLRPAHDAALREFLNCQLVPQLGNAWDYTFAPGRFPAVEWDRPELVERVMGPFPLRVRWFDGEGREPFNLVVARRGVAVLDEAFGKYPWGELTRETPAEMASITKLVTGVLFAQFVDQGLIGIDDPVGQ